MRQIPLAAIKEAAESVYQAAIRTPLVRLDLPFRDVGAPPAEIYLKLELLQPIGSFKIRGAWNAVRALSPEILNGGVWTVSAGNAKAVEQWVADLDHCVGEVRGRVTEDRSTSYSTID